MPFGEYEDWEDCISKNSDKGDPQAYCGFIKNKVEEALMKNEANEAIRKSIVAKEQDAQEPEGLTTPDAGDQGEDVTKDLTSPQGSSKEADNPNASGDGELGQTTSPQDQAEDPANPRDQAQPPNVGHQTTSEVSPDSEIKTNDKYGELNGDKYEKNEDELKDERRDEHQGLEYNGETYHKVKAIEYEDEIYVQKEDDKEEAKEEDLEYEDDVYRKADEDDLELDDDIYVKDNEQAPLGGDLASQPTPDIEVPELTPIGESVIIKENGKFRKYNVFQAKEQEEVPVEPQAEVPDQPPVEQPQGDVTDKPEEPEVQPIEQKEPSEDITAVEKIIIKENGKLKFKSVYTEVKKKL